MKLPQTMIDRACMAYWDALPDGLQAGANIDGMRAALEAALTDCPVGTVSTVTHVSVFIATRAERFDLWNKQVALVALDD